MREAEKELESLVVDAGATSRRTLCGDARLYIATSAQGERIPLAVRDGCVITVLQDRPNGVDPSADLALYEEHLADQRELQAKLAREQPEAAAAPTAPVPSESRPIFSKEDAKRIIRDWRNGLDTNRQDLRAAHKMLGLSFTLHMERIVEAERAVYQAYCQKNAP